MLLAEGAMVCVIVGSLMMQSLQTPEPVALTQVGATPGPLDFKRKPLLPLARVTSAEVLVAPLRTRLLLLENDVAPVPPCATFTVPNPVPSDPEVKLPTPVMLE